MKGREKIVRQYGLWESPISVDLIAGSSISFHEVVVNQTNQKIYSVESRPKENGRYAIVEHSVSNQLGAPGHEGGRDILPSQYSAHATVQELGGGSIAICPTTGTLVFADDNTQNVYRLNSGSGEVTLLIKAEKGVRYASFCVNPRDPGLVVAVKEDHRGVTPETQVEGVKNTLVILKERKDGIRTGDGDGDGDGSATEDDGRMKERLLLEGEDFYSHPKWSPDGRTLSWISWNHPDMPWTGTVLYVADWDEEERKLIHVTRVAGEAMKESIAQPKWGVDGGDTLYFASDRTEFWQLYTWREGVVERIVLDGLEVSEFAIAEWKMGASTYIPLSETKMVAATINSGRSSISIIDIPTARYEALNLEFSDLALPGNGLYRVSPTSFAVVGSTPGTPSALTIITLPDTKLSYPYPSPTLKTLKSSMLVPSTITTHNPKEIFSYPEYKSIPALRNIKSQNQGSAVDAIVHIYIYPPLNPRFTAPATTLPPCLILLHGGPNGLHAPGLDTKIQFFTSRGYLVCAVNYLGSTGYGRSYREALSGRWGISDVEDVASAVRYLVDTEKLIDGTRVGVYGGSAGGYATLQALWMYPDLWAAGVSMYGISDIEALKGDSYKFEGWDVERIMLGTTTTTSLTTLSKIEVKEAEEEKRSIMRQRSPRYHISEIQAPLLLLQGDKDVAVPPGQTLAMASEMEGGGKVAKVVMFEGEGHGWIKEGSIRRSMLEMEEWWRRWLVRPEEEKDGKGYGGS